MILSKEAEKRQTLSWTKGKLKKDRQYHGQRETDKRQTITWPNEN
jgi:hypothetical protein